MTRMLRQTHVVPAALLWQHVIGGGAVRGAWLATERRQGTSERRSGREP